MALCRSRSCSSFLFDLIDCSTSENWVNWDTNSFESIGSSGSWCCNSVVNSLRNMSKFLVSDALAAAVVEPVPAAAALVISISQILLR